MKLQKLIVAGFIAGSTFAAAHLNAAAWLTDLSAAQGQARAGNKLVLMNFTGSDWCGWCIKLRNEVFSQPEFAAFAAENLVLVEVDFPRQKPQSPQLQHANRQLAASYGIRGYPTIVVLNSSGSKVGELGYTPGGPKAFIGELQKVASGKLRPPAGAVADTPPARPEAPAPPLFNGAPTAPPPQYTGLTLKGISGREGSRFALINNQTLAVGETASVKLVNSTVKVKCVEIREQSVIVAVDGGSETRELRLADGVVSAR